MYENEQGVFPNNEFVFDLELPLEFVPKNKDGKVEGFELFTAQVGSVVLLRFAYLKD